MIFHGFYWLLDLIGLVDYGSVRILSFGAFLWPFFYFWGAKLSIFLVSQISVCRFGGMFVGEWYWIWSFLYRGTLTCGGRAWTCPLLRSGLQLSGDAPHRLGTPQHGSPNAQWKQELKLHNPKQQTDFVLWFTLHREYRTIILGNVIYKCYKYPQMYKTTSSPRNTNMKSEIHYLNTQLHITPCTYTDPLPDIDRCHDVYSVECNIVID